jgi:hypothetical protein
VTIEAETAGSVAHAMDWEAEKTSFRFFDNKPIVLEHCTGLNNIFNQ